MIAAWLDPSVVNNVILVLIGEQGTYKTTWFTYLLPPPLRRYFYIKTNANRMGRDDLITLAQYGLVCCEAGHHAPLGTQPVEGGSHHDEHRRACRLCPFP